MAQWIDAQGIIVDVTTLLAGTTAHNVFSYNPVDPAEFTSPQDVADWWQANVLAGWQALISSSATLINLQVSTNTGGGAPPYPPVSVSLSAVGGSDAQMLPPFVSMRLYKVPDLTSAQPSQPVPAWRMGMTRIPGIPENQQQKGVVTSTYMALWDEVGLDMVAGTADGIDIQMSMFRVVGSTLYGVGIDFIQAGSVLGSQNSRKI